MKRYALLDSISDPAQVRQLERRQLPLLAEELRAFLLESVARTGGHLSSNLGTVELTIALHYVFETPHDRLVWDVGHQMGRRPPDVRAQDTDRPSRRHG